MSSLWAQTSPTNLGPIRTTTQDLVGQAGPPSLPPANVCRLYYNTTTGVTTWLNSSGSPCGPSVGSCPNCVLTDNSGNATIAGDFTALELILSGSGPLDLQTPCNTVSAPSSGYGLLGMGTGCVPVIYPTALSAVVPVAYQDGFGNVYQNANTASAAKTAGSQCSGHYAIGVDVNWNAICDGSTYVLIPTITDPGAVASSLVLFGTTTDIQAHINGNSTAVTVLRKDNNYATFTCPISDATGAVYGPRFCNWTLPVGVTVVAYDLAIDNTATCTTYPVIQVWDGTAAAEVGSYSITLNGSTSVYTQVTGSSTVAAGHLLGMKVTTTGTCATAPHGAVAVITYQMS